MSTRQHSLPLLPRRGLLACAGAVLAFGGLAGCSTSTSAGGNNPPAPASTSTSTSAPASTTDTRTTRPTDTRSTTATEPPRTTTTSSSPAPGNGFDGSQFQYAMSAIGVTPTGSTSGKGTKGIGVMSYKFTMNGSSVAAINCTVQSEAADAQQSDQDAQTLASTFFTACADFNLGTDPAAKNQVDSFITSNLPGLQGEQPPANQVVGPVMFSLGKAAPGFYFLNMRH